MGRYGEHGTLGTKQVPPYDRISIWGDLASVKTVFDISYMSEAY